MSFSRPSPDVNFLKDKSDYFIVGKGGIKTTQSK
jgi:hypothetical protein